MAINGQAVNGQAEHFSRSDSTRFTHLRLSGTLPACVLDLTALQQLSLCYDGLSGMVRPQC